jgi:acyl carrier protein
MPKNKISREEIESRVKQIISKTTSTDIKKLKPELRLQDDLGMDSFTGIELAYNAEDEFGISIEDDELIKLRTIGDIINTVERKLAL